MDTLTNENGMESQGLVHLAKALRQSNCVKDTHQLIGFHGFEIESEPMVF